MSSPPPIPCVYANGCFTPLPRFQRVADHHYGEGEVVPLIRQEERSEASHAHFFATVNEAWKNLPETVADRFPTADGLRKWALIKGGFCDQRSVACESKAQALKVAAWSRQFDPEAIVVVNDNVVTAYSAHSQSYRAMGKDRFQASKSAVLEIIAELIGVDPKTLSSNAGKAA